MAVKPEGFIRMPILSRDVPCGNLMWSTQNGSGEHNEGFVYGCSSPPGILGTLQDGLIFFGPGQICTPGNDADKAGQWSCVTHFRGKRSGRGNGDQPPSGEWRIKIREELANGRSGCKGRGDFLNIPVKNSMERY